MAKGEQKPQEGAAGEQAGGKKPEGKQKPGGMANIFIAQTIYPDPSAIFTFRLKSVNEIKDDCFVVLDTNALLLPYTTSQESLQQIQSTYARLKAENRLRVPAQVAREFAKNRPTKLTELYQKLVRRRDASFPVEGSNYPLLEGLAAYKELATAESELRNAIKKYREILEKLQTQVRLWNWNDPVSELYSELFTSETIVDHVRGEADIISDLQVRATHEIPPGYKDGNKDDEGIGDLLIWYAILELGKVRNVIFVTGETKSDWWYRSEKQAIYPRYELIDEFRQYSSGKSFHMLTLSELLKLFGAQESVVQQVKQEEQRRTLSDNLVVTPAPATLGKARITKAEAERAFFVWLEHRYKDYTILLPPSGAGFDFYFKDNTDRWCVFDIQIVSERSILSILRHYNGRYSMTDNNNKPVRYVAVLVASNSSIAEKVFDAVEGRPEFNNIPIITGYLHEDGTFIAILDEDFLIND